MVNVVVVVIMAAEEMEWLSKNCTLYRLNRFAIHARSINK